MSEVIAPICIRCKKKPHEISTYVDMAKEDNMSPADFVKTGEGTYCHRTGYFWCDECYIKLGMPLGKAREL